MKKAIYKINYDGIDITYQFIYSTTKYYFGKYISLSESKKADIKIDKITFEKAKQLLPDGTLNPYIEYRGLISLTAKKLLKYKCCVFHAVSFVYKNRAWLLSAPSKTGKTTQYLNWTNIYPKEITMISGDMPILELKEQNVIVVHPSPWNGKEKIGDLISAPLGGIIYLKQSSLNQINKMSISEGAQLLLNQYMCFPETETEIKTLFSQLDCIFSNYPVLIYNNTGTKESTEILRSKINELIQNEI